MQLTSNNFGDQERIPPDFTCDGPGRSPHLAWPDAPQGTAGFALSVIDPDAPSGHFVHWLMYNIPGEVREIPENMTPNGAVQVENDFGIATYGGPCPPAGAHRYVFTLYALRELITESVTNETFLATVKRYELDHATLTGLYQRAP